MKPTLKCLITRGMALIFFALFGQSVWAASLSFDNSTDPAQVAVTAGQFEGGFSVNGAALASGATVMVAETANSCVVSYTGTWIDLGDAATVDRTIYFVDTVDPAIVTDILVFDVVTGATVTGTWTSDACGPLPPVPGGTPAGDIVPADGTSAGISAAFLLGSASAVVREFDLGLAVVDTPDPVVAGSGASNLTHTFTLSRSGPSDATGVEVAITPTLPAGVTPVSFTPSVGAMNGLVWEVGDWPASENGTDQTLIITLTVDETAAECTDCVSAEGTVSAINGNDTDDTNDTAINPTSIDREFDLGLSVVDSPDPVLAGTGTDNLTHTFTLSRSGPSDASGVEVAIVPTLPAGVTPVSFTPSVGAMNGLVWEVGDWPASENGTDQTLIISLTVDATATDCTDCVSAEGTVSATSGTDTNGDNDTAVNPTSIETAAGGGSTTFPVTINFSNDFDGSVMVSLTCNTGNPLSQEFEITEAGGVDFVVQILDFIDPATTCEVILTDIDGAYFSDLMLANGEDTGSSCVFSGTPVSGESAPFNPDRSNTCAIAAQPTPNVWTVSKVWMDGGSDISQEAVFTWFCTNASPLPLGGSEGFGDTFVKVGEFDNVEVTLYPAPGMTATCSAIEDIDLLDDSVETDQGCVPGNEFTIGSGDDGCTITNTVFYEGIPSLNQYGLALMALLMLGVGMVGFRRFA